MKTLTGKKLLVLAGSSQEIDLVKRAKELGIYTVVTDYYDEAISPAKTFVDEAWNISWSDIDALEKICRKQHIDGVLAGYSEFTVECMIKLCKRLDLPCYITEEQLNITRDKLLFKEVCRKNGVPTIKEFASPDDVSEFPVIVKPVDRSGSIGISIATNKEELLKAYQYAMEMSVCKKVIIETYITQGTKFDACYAISGGNIVLFSTEDTINAKNNGFEKVVQSGWFTPSKYHEKFLKEADAFLKDMIKDMGIKEGTIFFSGFADGESFAFFETGFRLGGAHMQNFSKARGVCDVYDLLIYHALTGNTNDVPVNENAGSDLKGVILNFYAKEGTFSHFQGLEEVAKMPACNLMLPMCYKGKVCTEDTAILTKLGMIHLYDTDPNVLKQSADEAYKTFGAFDALGRDMIFDRIDTNIIPAWWDK